MAVKTPPFRTNPSTIARYFFHDCERFLYYSAASPQQRKREGIPSPEFDQRAFMYKTLIEKNYDPMMAMVFTNMPEDAKPNPEVIEKIREEMQASEELRLKATDKDKEKARKMFISAVYPEMSLLEELRLMLKPMDLLWAFLAAGSAWKICSRIQFARG